MPTTRQTPTRAFRARSTVKPEIRLQMSVTASSVYHSRRAENVEYQLIESRRQNDLPPRGGSGRPTQLTDSNSSTTATPGDSELFQLHSTRRPLSTRRGATTATVREYRTTSAHFDINTTSVAMETDLVMRSSFDEPADQQAVEGDAVSPGAVDTDFTTAAMLRTTAWIERQHTKDEDDELMTSQGDDIVTTATYRNADSTASQLTHRSLQQTDPSQTSEYLVTSAHETMTSSIAAHSLSSSSSSYVDISSLSFDVNSTTTARVTMATDRRSHDSHSDSIAVNETTTIDRLFSVGQSNSIVTRPDSATNIDNRRNGSVPFGFYSPDGAKVTVLCAVICLLLLLIPMLSVAICRRQRRQRRRGNAVGDGGGKRKKTALQRSAYSSAGGGYSCAYDTPIGARLPLKRPTTCCTGDVDCNGCTAAPLSSHPTDDGMSAAAAKCRAKRYRTRVRDDIELERLHHQQPDDWGTPPPSYRQLIPGSPASLFSSSAACATSGGSSAGPTRRSRRPLFFGSGGVVDLSSTKVYDLVPEPPPPPLPPRAGLSSYGFRCSSSYVGVGKTDTESSRNVNTPEINGKRLSADQFYGYLMRSALNSSIVSVDGIRHSKDHGLGQGKTPMDRGFSTEATRAQRRPLPRVPCDFVRSSLTPTVAVAVRCDAVVSPEDGGGDAVDRQRRRFPKMGRSCLMDSLRHRQALSMIASPNGTPNDDAIGYAQSVGDDVGSSSMTLSSPAQSTYRVDPQPNNDAVSSTVTEDQQQVIHAQSTTV